MIGLRVGLKVGVRPGLAVGLGADPLSSGGAANPMAGVTKDGTSNIYVPANAAEWLIALGVAGIASGGPSNIWSFQEASGNVIDANAALNLMAAGAPSYQQAVAGWSRKGITLAQAGTALFSATIPSAATSCLVFALIALTGAPGGARSMLEHPNIFAEADASSFLRADGASLVTGSVSLSTTVHMVVLKSNVATSSEGVFWETEKLEPTYSTLGGTTLVVGGSASNGAPMTVLSAVRFSGSAAEMSNANIKSLMQTLGKSVVWS